MADLLAVVILTLAIVIGMEAVKPEGFNYMFNDTCYSFKINTENDKKIDISLDKWEC